MKKLMSLLVLFAILLSMAACGGEEPAQATTAATEATQTTEPTQQDSTGLQELTPEDMYGHINQLEPLNGTYMIWNAEGVKNMQNHPDGNFELLCNVDMGGAEIAPIGSSAKPFTGKINGGNFTISNFTLAGGAEGDFGFVAVNQGKIQNLTLDQVSFRPDPAAKNIGSIAGVNEGNLVRCKITGELPVEQAADNANCGSCVGINRGSISYTELFVDLKVTAAGSANVGGIAGLAEGGNAEYVETSGRLEIEGEQKTVGLFAGTATDTVLSNSVFLGERNSLNGQLFINFTGNEDDELAVALEAAYRVNDHHEALPENVQKLRDRVVEEMNAMGTVEWKLHQDLVHTCTCQLSGCNGTYNSSTTYIGIPYNHKGGSLNRMKYLLDEEGYMKSWVYDVDSFDGFDMYMGNDCSTSIIHAYWTVSNSADFSRCQYMLPQMREYPNVATGLDHDGVYAVGDYNCDFTLPNNRYTECYWEHNTEQEMYEAYGALRKGDAYVYISKLGGHTRMAAADAVVVRKQNGEIDPKYSYVLSSEQGSTTRQDLPDGSQVVTTWKVNHKYTFANLRYDTAVPVTIEELLTGEMEPATCQMLGGMEGYAGMYNGTVKANYYLDNVDLEIKDSKGEVVFFHTLWTTTDKYYDRGHCDGQLRNYKDDFDMAKFATPLSRFQFELGETYSYTVTGHLHTYDDFVVHEGSFVYGQTP